MNTIFAILISYFIGSIPFAYILGKVLAGKDLREIGSGNLGSTNVLRIIGVKAGVICLVLDILKGVLIYVIISSIYPSEVLVSSIFAILGHCYSPFVGFRGGKGVAISVGILLGMNILVAISWPIIQIILILIDRRMSVASLLSAAVHPIIAYIFTGTTNYFYLTLFITPFIFFTHRENISRIIKKEEKKLF